MVKNRKRKSRKERRMGKEAVAENHGEQVAQAVIRTKEKISRDMHEQRQLISKITTQIESLTGTDPVTTLKRSQLEKQQYRYRQSWKAKELLLVSPDTEKILKYRHRKSHTAARRIKNKTKNPFHKRQLRQSRKTNEQIKYTLEKEQEDLDLSCSDLSSNDDETDDEYVLSDDEKNTDRKRKSSSVRMLRGSLQNTVVGTVDHDFIDVEIYENESFPWIYELQQLDANVSKSFQFFTFHFQTSQITHFHNG